MVLKIVTGVLCDTGLLDVVYWSIKVVICVLYDTGVLLDEWFSR